MLEVIKLGTDVVIYGKIEAKITAITLREGYVAYECSWITDFDRKSAYFQEFEFSIGPQAEKKKIGFVNE